MDSMIYNPLEEYQKTIREKQLNIATAYFDDLVNRSNVNVEENKKTVKEYSLNKDKAKSLKKKIGWLKFLRVLAIITIILIPLVIVKLTPYIRKLKEQLLSIDTRVAELFQTANGQMAPLNSLFSDRDAINIIEKTIPQLKFDRYFSHERMSNMTINFDLPPSSSLEQSALDVLSGEYNGNPFFFEKRLLHTMGTWVYHGYKTIYWTETYRDSNGRLQTRRRSQTLHACVERPKPFYNTQLVLNYGAQGGPELCFSRDATNLDDKTEKEIERYVKKGEKKLKKKTDEAIKKNQDFVSMSNSEFEVLFDALNRTDEVQFRTLFTPLAQTNMVDLLLSKDCFGDDFDFYKVRRLNTIVSRHSQGRNINLYASEYYSYSFDIIKENFINKNAEFFKNVYFDFAPLWAIPIYQEEPVHSLDPLPNLEQRYSYKECESLVNLLDYRHVAHPLTKTQAILKSSYAGVSGKGDRTRISAYSYDIIGRVDFIPVLGGDGFMHSVPVPWDEYIPIEAHKDFCIAPETEVPGGDVLARKNGLCIYSLE